ncbi:MAG: polysulfide reductase NrfD [Aigarchaeota archaeon]|nr:polysulfide reductase NrfD [Candidatus Pelearchaeum maunauluense]
MTLFAELYLASRQDIIQLKATTKGIKGALYRILSAGAKEASLERHAKDMKIVRVLAIVGIPVAAIGVHGGTGAIFGVVGSRPLWYGPYTPIYFVPSAMLSGAAFLLAIYIITNKLMGREKLKETINMLKNVVLLLLFLEWFFIFWEAIVSLWPTSPIEDIETASRLLFGPYWYVFWVIEFLIGFIVPAGILLGRRASRIPVLMVIAGLLIVIGIIGIRFNIVLPTLSEAPLPHLPAEWNIKQMPWKQIPAYPGTVFGWIPNYGGGVPYFPSIWEILVQASIITFLILLYSLAVKFVPLQEVVRNE